MLIFVAVFPGCGPVPTPSTSSSAASAKEGPSSATQSTRSVDWPVYGANPAGNRFSDLDQINRNNVGQLRMAWAFEMGGSSLQTSPIVIDGVLYGYTPSGHAIALEADTGKLLWTFDPGLKSGAPARGLTMWSEGAERRLFAGIMNWLYALDPETGSPIASFGEGGRIDLRNDLRDDVERMPLAMTSPGVVYRDLIIAGFRTSESKPAPPGDIRAYDVRSGALRWSFHTIPHPGEFGYDTWPEGSERTAGGANNWTGMTLDEERGIVFVPTGSAVDDFYGGDRAGDNLFANCLIALNAETGERIWHFQGVHHDIWDRDFPSPPVLLTVERGGKKTDAVAQPSKQGFLFVFDRVTGEPLFDIEERPFPASDVPGEWTSPTQPIPVKPGPYARQVLTEDMLTNRSPKANAWAREQFAKFRSDGPFVPFSIERPTVVFPDYDGGAEWGGSAADPHGVVYLNSNDIASTGGLKVPGPTPSAGEGEQLYQYACAACHGPERKGFPPETPSLVGIASRMDRTALAEIVRRGKGRMAGLPHIPNETLGAIVEFLANDGTAAPAKQETKSAAPPEGPPKFHFTGYARFLDPEGYPAVAPPWGTLNAIDLNTGETLWKVTLGEYPELIRAGMPPTGSQNYGGPVVTAGELLFIGATIHDRQLRAFDTATGAELWRYNLPFAGLATPITYMVNGVQYIVIAASGARDPSGPQGAAYVAFKIP